MADASALPVLVDALTENVNRRRDVIKVLKALRGEAWPLIEQRLASGAIPAELEQEIRSAFESGAIVKWQIIGPFENVWGAVHPARRRRARERRRSQTFQGSTRARRRRR
jgi:hypothetical protein